MRRWYVVNTKPRAEGIALFHLLRQGFEAYLPRLTKRRRHARRVDTVPVPLFPGYLFVAFDFERTRWRSVGGTVGVNRLICHGDRPAPVPEGIVEDIRGREDDEGFVLMAAESTFKKGTLIEIADGPLAEARGIFECMDSRERVVVLLNLLGREVRARVPLGWVQANA